MSQLQPDYYIPRITGIGREFLAKKGIRGLVLDVDNTLTLHDDPTPDPDIARWLEEMRAAGIPMVIVSNNSEERVAPFAKILGLPFVADGEKPKAGGMERAAKVLGGLRPEEMAVIGDQIFTDVWGGNRFGAVTILVAPLGPEIVPFIKFKRVLEKFVLRGRKPRALEEER